MKITVTKDDIVVGRKSDPGDCPVARALRRAGVAHFGVTGMTGMIEGRQQHGIVLLPAPVQEWIVEYDLGFPVEPMAFDLTLPAPENWASEASTESPEMGRHRNALRSRCCSARRVRLAGFWIHEPHLTPCSGREGIRQKNRVAERQEGLA
jgi:hypothetical protein